MQGLSHLDSLEHGLTAKDARHTAPNQRVRGFFQNLSANCDGVKQVQYVWAEA